MLNEKQSKKFISESPKLNFFFGLVIGIAVIAVIGFVVLIITRDNTQMAQENVNQQVAGAKEEQEIDLKINDNDYVLGSKDAAVKIFEFSDFQCPYCARHHETLHQIIEEYGDKVAWVFKQFPIASHPLGMPGALATECAGEQDKFWEMSDKIFGDQEELSMDSFEQFASELGLSVEQFKTCVAEEKYKDKVLADYNLGIESGVSGTPTNFINNEMVPGAIPYENLKEMIDSLLK